MNIENNQPPITEVILLKSPLEIDKNNQITFSNLQAQYTYFNSLPKIVFDNFTYQRHDGYIRIPKDMDSILDYNYVMYKNANYNNKWFYAFITKMTWQNPNMTDIYIETDVFQTWQFNITYKPSFIEREHVNDDTIGLHTIPENIDTGDYLIQGVYKDSMGSEGNVICMATTIDPTIDSSGNLVGGNNGGGIYGGVPTGYRLYTFNPVNNTFKNVLKAFESAGKIDAIIGIFVAPRKMLITDTTINSDNYQIPDFYNTRSIAFEIPKPTGLINYQPRNNKLLIFPYRYLEITNNNGMNAIYNYEYFSQPFADFIIDFVPTIGGSCILSPNSYKNYATNPIYPEGINGAKYPIAGWQTDVFINWLTQNGVNTSLNIATNALNAGIGALSTGLGIGSNNPWATLGGIQQISSGLEGIANTMGNIYERSLTPPQANGQTNIGDVNYTLGNCSFTAYQKSIKTEYAKIIDGFFDMFGYKVNTIKIPNILGRQNWNYIKTIGLNIIGDIPQEAINELKEIFDKGITLWHNTSTYLDYSQPNNII